MTRQRGRREGAGGREGQGSGPGEAGRGEDGRTGGREARRALTWGLCALGLPPPRPCSLARARPWRQERPEHYFPLRCE